MQSIKFSHVYQKMPRFFHRKKRLPSQTFLVAVDSVGISSIPKDFLDWDTQTWELNEAGDGFTHFELPKEGMVLILTLFTKGEDISPACWTTIRRWTKEKEDYYRTLVGQEVGIEFTGGQP